jgi:hypothetical protein
MYVMKHFINNALNSARLGICKEMSSIFVQVMQSGCGRGLLIFNNTQGTKEFFLNHKTNIIAKDTIFQSCSLIKKKFYLES